ncbi:MAG: ATP-binding protein [Ignavibacteriales bacterium]|nr:ATP-binding protein [Ignavibacteriales bacterium]
MINLYTTSLRSKILLGFTVILLIMFFATLWSIYNFYYLNESIKKTMQENYTSIIAADNMGRSLDEQLQAIVIMYNQNFEQGERLFQKYRDDFYFWYDRARLSVVTQEGKNILDSLNVGYQKLQRDISNIDYNIYRAEKYPALRTDFVRFLNEIQAIKKINYGILEINHTSLNSSVSHVIDITQSATIAILIILFSAIGISLTFGSRFSDYIVKPITKLRESVTHIAEGHFDERIEIDENADEINSLAEEFNKMSEKLQVYERFNLNKILYEKKKSELIIESMNEAVLLVDENFNIILSNKTFNESFPPELFDLGIIRTLLSPDKNKQNGKKYSDQEERFLKDDIMKVKDRAGNQKYFKVIAASLEIPESDMKGTVIVFNDITKYQELDRMKSEFVAKVSHELKTPLTSLGMALGIIEDKIVGELTVQQNELIVSMKEDYERLNRLVYEILELTKLESSIGRVKFEKFAAHKLAEHILKKFSILAKEHNIVLIINDESHELKINGSYDNIISAIENLVSNSLRFTPNGGKINVRFSRAEENLLIEISDTGIGISPDNLKKIFDKFIQIDDTAPGSLGLGLSIAKEIIELHHGEIKAFSALGQGSTFQIKLPAA